MDTHRVLLVVVFILLSLLMGCSPEVGVPDDFQRHSELVERGEVIQKVTIVEWLGEPERVIKVSKIILETEQFRDYKESHDKQRAEEDVQFTLDSWYHRYANIKGISIDGNSKWSSDDAFMASNIWGYYFENPLEVKVAYRKWIGTTMQTTIKKSLFFVEIGKNELLAVPSLKRK
ncbi:MAG TPA: hypothetical protein P5279_17390 [Anaerohalosphaeraceae bacterium]|nr:hypothetical protein [Anaerohalosphaeraceae bacterium]